MTLSNKYEFNDPKSGIKFHVEHVYIPSKNEIPGGREEESQVHQQPSSVVSIEVPDGANYTLEQLCQRLTGKDVPDKSSIKNGRLVVGIVTNVLGQMTMTNALQATELFAEDTLLAVHECCNHPAPNRQSTARGDFGPGGR